MSYHTSRTVQLTFERAQQRMTEELQTEGFGILTEVDVTQTLKQKLDLTMRKYRILGACHPQLASRALAMERYVGLFMPCNVIVQEVSETATELSVIDPTQAMQAIGNPELHPFARDVRDKLAAALSRV